MVVHKLPGGGRVVDTLGPDEADIYWNGQFFGDEAYATALVLDSIRQSGQVVPLIWAGQYRSVIIASFNYALRREPVWVEYQIVCMVKSNPMAGVLGAVASSVESLVLSDLAVVSGL